MTQLERIKRLEASIAFWDRLIPIEMLKAEKQTHFSVELREDMRIALAALRGPQPDPETGLMPCGCGGKAEVGDGNKAFCGRCGITTLEQFTQEDAKSEWNRAMGVKGADE